MEIEWFDIDQRVSGDRSWIITGIKKPRECRAFHFVTLVSCSRVCEPIIIVGIAKNEHIVGCRVVGQ